MKPFIFMFVPLLLNMCGSNTTKTGAPTPKSDDVVSVTTKLDDEEKKFLDLINAYRQENKKTELAIDDALSNAADWLSVDMAQKDYFSHTDSLKRDPFQRMTDFLYNLKTTMAENIAAGNADAQATFTQWKNSPGHNTNMLGPYLVIGIGRAFNAKAAYEWYWTTDFGGAKRTQTATKLLKSRQ